MYTEKKKDKATFRASMTTAIGGGVGGALVGAGAAIFLGGPVGLAIIMGAMVGYGVSLMASLVR